MSHLVADCPRCRAQKMTFNVTADSPLRHLGGYYYYEAFCICRECNNATIFELRSTSAFSKGSRPVPPTEGGRYTIQGYVSVAYFSTTPTPEHSPSEIADVFQEGAKCMVVGCFNAAGAMFRLCLDLATKKLASSSKAKLNLSPRLTWLFDNGKLPDSLKELSSVVKDDGNDAAHDGTLDEAAAEDLLIFTERLLTQLYTEPKKIAIAQQRRQNRNTP